MAGYAMTSLRDRCCQALANDTSICVSPREVMALLEKLQVAERALEEIGSLKNVEPLFHGEYINWSEKHLEAREQAMAALHEIRGQSK